MNMLEKMGAENAYAHLDKGYGKVCAATDNLSDIELYLNSNIDDLPENGEVSPKELLHLIESSIKSFEEAQEELKKSSNWVSALQTS